MYICTSSHFLAKNGSFLKIAQSLNRSKISPKLPTYLPTYCRYLPTESSFFISETLTDLRYLRSAHSDLGSASRQQPAVLELVGCQAFWRRRVTVLVEADSASGRGGFWRARGGGTVHCWRIAGSAVSDGSGVVFDNWLRSSVSRAGRFRPFWGGRIRWKPCDFWEASARRGSGPINIGRGRASILLNRVWRRPFLAFLAGQIRWKPVNFGKGLARWFRGSEGHPRKKNNNQPGGLYFVPLSWRTKTDGAQISLASAREILAKK